MMSRSLFSSLEHRSQYDFSIDTVGLLVLSKLRSDFIKTFSSMCARAATIAVPNESGQYPYFCTFHPCMVVTITVSWGWLPFCQQAKSSFVRLWISLTCYIETNRAESGKLCLNCHDFFHEYLVNTPNAKFVPEWTFTLWTNHRIFLSVFSRQPYGLFISGPVST
jgi:hypothetical protein